MEVRCPSLEGGYTSALIQGSVSYPFKAGISACCRAPNINFISQQGFKLQLWILVRHIRDVSAGFFYYPLSYLLGRVA